MFEEVKLSPEEMTRVEQIIQTAFSEMAEVSQGIGGHAAMMPAAYNGSGTALGVETYENLGKAGQALAEALNGLSMDLGLTTNTGLDTDADAHGALGTAIAPPSDMNIAMQV
jgi:uncharacterized protein YukE